MYKYNVPFYYFVSFAVGTLLLCGIYHLCTIKPKRKRYGELTEKEQSVINMSTD
jgi:hypothetical protein